MASLVKSVAKVGGLTLVSRVLGFVRDILTAKYAGASAETDAFFVAFKLPNFMRRLFAEGAFNSAFVPQFNRYLAEGGKEEAKAFATEAMSFLFFVLLVLTILIQIFMPSFVMLMAPGFSDSGGLLSSLSACSLEQESLKPPAFKDKFELTVELTRITFPYLLMISLVSLLGGVLNSMNYFGAVAATPILMNLSFIGALLFLSPYFEHPVYALAWGVFISGIVQFLWLVRYCRKIGMMPSLRWPRLTQRVKRLLKIIGPAALGAGVAQINLMVDTIMVSCIPDGVSYLYYADRISELPLGVIGIAIGTVLLPTLSRALKEGKTEQAMHQQNRSVELGLFLTLPCALGLMVMAEPIIRILFERGEFTAADTAATFPALVAYSAGLPAFVMIKCFAPGFFANEDTKTPFYIALFCLLLNIFLNLLLIGPFQHVGLAASTSFVSWLNVMLMVHILHRRGYYTMDAMLKRRLPRIVAAGLLMTTATVLVMMLADPLGQGNMIFRIIYLCLVIGTGAIVYLAASYFLRAFDVEVLKRSLRRSPPEPAAE
jgi:putative peptidoglycan lipid II flippase